MNWKKISLVRWSFVALAKLGLSGKGLVIAVPTLWLLIFFLIPFVFIAKISFSEAVIQQPPYLPLTIFNEEGVLQISLNFSNYQYLLEDTLYFLSYLASLKIAFFSTIFCLLIGYPLAYYIARSSEVKRNFLLLLIVLPFWTSFLYRLVNAFWSRFLNFNTFKLRIVCLTRRFWINGVRLADLNYLSILHYSNPRRQGHCFFLVVGDNYKGNIKSFLNFNDFKLSFFTQFFI